MTCALNCLSILGISGVIVLVSVLLFSYRGLTVCYQLGKSLSKKRISLFGDANDVSELNTLIKSYKLFKNNNIRHVGFNNIDAAVNDEIWLFFYNGNNSEFLRHVLENHPAKSNLIVYVPPPYRLNDDIMERMRKSSSVILVNYRGRLLHDLVTSMMLGDLN